ncbi:MAG: XRE family transcriptional regulator [Helicobacteraceae bacterium]|jgi:phage repressor protein C with HTH and peptisase S24 domain|nr:XRE family transcriptional regulator [Helicobacteraceae bacterium]
MDAERLERALKAKYGDRGARSRLARELNVSSSSITHYLGGKRQIPDDKIVSIARKLDVSIDYLMGEKIYPVKLIPIIGAVSCGAPERIEVGEARETYYRADYWNDQLYAVVACGDSMSPEIDDGDEVVCDPSAPILHGDIVHYKIRSESAIKVLLKDEKSNLIRLKPYNLTPDFRTLTIRLDDDEANDLKMTKVVSVNKAQFNNRAARLRILGEI